MVYIRSTGANRNNDEPTVSVVYTSEAAAAASPVESPRFDRRDPRRDSSVFKPVDIKKARLEFQKAAEEQAARNFSSVAPKQAAGSTHLQKTTSKGITISSGVNGASTNGTHAAQNNQNKTNQSNNKSAPSVPKLNVSPPTSPRTAPSQSQSSSAASSPRSAKASPREPLTPTGEQTSSPDASTEVKKPKPLPKPPQKKVEEVPENQPDRAPSHGTCCEYDVF